MSATNYEGRKLAIGEIVFAAIATLAGIGILAGSFTIPVPDSADTLGPRTMPIAIGALTLAVSLWILVGLFRGQRGQAEESEDVDLGAGTDWVLVGAIAGIVIVHTVLIIPLGWPIAAMVLFVGAGLMLGARPWWKVAIVAVIVALVIQFVFAYLLGVSLPPGPVFERLEFFHG